MFIGQFGGTDAAEGITAPFCRCPTCTEAREKGGRQVRLRSCFRLSDKRFISFHKLEYGVRTQIDDIYVTPFKGTHTGNVQENTALYLIELPDGRTPYNDIMNGPARLQFPLPTVVAYDRLKLL